MRGTRRERKRATTMTITTTTKNANMQASLGAMFRNARFIIAISNMLAILAEHELSKFT